MGKIGRRIATAAKHFRERNYESAAGEIFMALDATGAKRFGAKEKNGVRFKRLIEQQEDIVTFTAIGSCLIGVRLNDKSIAEAVWEFGRNPLLHEAGLGDRISFEGDSRMVLGHKWEFSADFLVGLMVGVISAKENADERGAVEGAIRFGGFRLQLRTLWGAEDFLREIVGLRTGRLL